MANKAPRRKHVIITLPPVVHIRGKAQAKRSKESLSHLVERLLRVDYMKKREA